MSQIKLSENFIKSNVKLALNEDLYPSGDITSGLIKDNKIIEAKLISNQNAMIGGLLFAKYTFLLVDKKELPNKYDQNILLISNDYSLKYFLNNIFTDLKRQFTNQSEDKSINTTSTNYKKYKVIIDTIKMVIKENPINIVFTPYLTAVLAITAAKALSVGNSISGNPDSIKIF